MLIFYNIWVVFTLLLFYFGPVPWPQGANGLVAIVVLGCLLFFNLGARFGSALPVLPEKRLPLLYDTPLKWAVALLFLALSAFHTYGVTDRLIFDPTAYSLDFHAVYMGFQETLRGRDVTGLANALLLLKAAMMPAVLLLIVYGFREQPALLVVLLFPFAASSAMRGTDKESVDLILYLLVLSYYHKVLGRRFLLAAALVVGVIALFTVRKMARFEEVYLTCLPGSPDACFDFQNWISLNISPGIEFLRIMLTNYITQGYEGMGRALSLPFEFNWGLGHMQTVKYKLCDVLRIACDSETFEQRLIDVGWDTRNQWSSAYTAIANDFHWLFAPVYTFVLGAIFGVSEKSWKRNRDRFSLACLLLITLFFVYSSANMQVTISLEWTAVYLALFSVQLYRIAVARPSVTLQWTRPPRRVS